MMLDRLRFPIVQAPMAGGPSTPELAAAVSNAGALGFIAAGYRTTEALDRDIAATRALTDAPFGANVFAPSGAPADPAVVSDYSDALRGEAQRAGVELGDPRFDDDQFDDKIALLCADPVAAVSFTFGCPTPETVARLQAAGSSVWVTVTEVPEARIAVEAGADVLVVQGVEAGGHRASFQDREDPVDFGVLALLQLVAAQVDVPLVATGGIATGRGIAAVLVAGAAAAQLGTAFMRSPEAATSPPHREALSSSRRTALTRAFTGRLARGIVNRLTTDHRADAPIAYPEIHHVTAPLRAHGRETGDQDVVNLWAGQAHELAEEVPAAELVERLAREAEDAIDEVQRRLGAERRA